MQIRGVRGATSVKANTKDNILNETSYLLEQLMTANDIEIDNVASIFFSLTEDLNAEFPAIAARKLGFYNTPLLCLNEVNVPGSLKQCIRILMHLNSSKAQAEIKHIYLNEAKSLRPEFAGDDK
jgi:chorismate mutase